MKIAYASDLHLEFCKYQLQKPEDPETTLILAGDITPISKLNKEMDYSWSYDSGILDFFYEATNYFKNVIYVAGNHEFYGGELEDIKLLKKLLSPCKNLHILNNEFLELDGIKFFGGTMWTNYDNEDPLLEMNASRLMNDYQCIGDLTPQTAKWEFYKFNNKLNEIRDQNIDVVISHHAPSYQCTSPKYADNKYNGLYCSNVDVSNIKYWIYGHLHGGLCIEQDGCQILNNTRGYPREDGFDEFELKYFEV